MIKSTMYIAIAILALGFGSANAQTFNFESKNDIYYQDKTSCKI